MVAEYDASPGGEKGAILRREWPHHIRIIELRAAHERGGGSRVPDQLP
ncbi:hypothetical protein ACFVP3_29630 [Streptomyces sp. NPDC057806]